MATGASAADVRFALRNAGVDPELAERLIREIGDSTKARELLSTLSPRTGPRVGGLRHRATAKALIGAAFFVGGIWGTVSSYGAAGPGETYFVLWGAIAFGGWNLLKAIEELTQ